MHGKKQIKSVYTVTLLCNVTPVFGYVLTKFSENSSACIFKAGDGYIGSIFIRNVGIYRSNYATLEHGRP
jgi:hypothetical protein